MTEQEQIASIDALTAVILKEQRGLQWDHVQDKDKEGLRHSTVTILRSIHARGMLGGYEIYRSVLGRKWEEASHEEHTICMNAARAAREVIESEERQGVGKARP